MCVSIFCIMSYYSALADGLSRLIGCQFFSMLLNFPDFWIEMTVAFIDGGLPFGSLVFHHQSLDLLV